MRSPWISTLVILLGLTGSAQAQQAWTQPCSAGTSGMNSKEVSCMMSDCVNSGLSAAACQPRVEEGCAQKMYRNDCKRAVEAARNVASSTPAPTVTPRPSVTPTPTVTPTPSPTRTPWWGGGRGATPTPTPTPTPGPTPVVVRTPRPSTPTPTPIQHEQHR